MEFIDFVAQEDDEERRLSKILKSIFNEKKINVFEIIRKKLIKVNNQKVKEDCKIKFNDKISIPDFLLKNEDKTQNLIATDLKNHTENSKINQQENVLKNSAENFPVNKKEFAQKTNQKKSDLKLEILFQNEHILIINKAKGINVQPGNKNEISLSQIVEENFSKQNKTSLSFKVGPLHRIDKFTSGAVCFSQSLKGARWFSENIKNHKICKIYVGILEGFLENNEIWQDYLKDSSSDEQNNLEYKQKKFTVSARKSSKISKKNDDFHKMEKSSSGEKNSKLCITKVFPVEHKIFYQKKYTVCLLKIETGRKHQIRCQSFIHGHSLAGDTIYNGRKFAAGSKEFSDFFLHSYFLKFPENSLGIPQEIFAPFSDEFKSFINLDLINQKVKSIIYK